MQCSCAGQTAQAAPPLPQAPALSPVRQASPAQQPEQLLEVQAQTPFWHSCPGWQPVTHAPRWQLSHGPHSAFVQQSPAGMQRPWQSLCPAGHWHAPPMQCSCAPHAAQVAPSTPQAPSLSPSLHVSPAQQPPQLADVQVQRPFWHSCPCWQPVTQAPRWQLSHGPHSLSAQQSPSAMQCPPQSFSPLGHRHWPPWQIAPPPHSAESQQSPAGMHAPWQPFCSPLHRHLLPRHRAPPQQRSPRRRLHLLPMR
jgi:hypothetical protein